MRRTAFTHTTGETGGKLEIAAATGDFTTDYTSRTYTIRLHTADAITAVKLDGRVVGVTKRAQDADAFPLAECGAAPDGDVYEADLAASHTLTWSTAAVLAGDANGDGTVTVADALCALRALIAGVTISAADMDGDGVLALADILQILRVTCIG